MIRLALAFLLACASPAFAEFGDCDDPGYLTGFADAPTADDLTCIVLFDYAHAAPGGERRVRAITDAAGGWAVPADVESEVRRGAEAATALLATLGEYRIDDVTLLLLDDVHDLGDGPEIEGVTLAGPDGRTGECLITLYGLSSGATRGTMAVLVAHEMFHCVQAASWPAAYQTYNDGGAWWIEGSAEAFAGMAVPGSAAETARAIEFDASVAEGRALNEMAHEAAVFFYWLVGPGGGPSAFLPFLGQMAESAGEAAQHAAMRAALSAAGWRDFATAYADAQIPHPQGGNLGVVPPDRIRLSITETSSHDLRLSAFVLQPGLVHYDCGVFGNIAPGADANLSFRPDTGGDWLDWPSETDTRDGRPSDFQIIALPVGDPGPARLEVERRAGCRPCAGVSTLDRCLIGTWEMTSGGPEDWLRAQGLPVRTEMLGPRLMTLRDDGLYGTEPFGITAEYRDEDVVFSADGRVTVAFGSWSATDGQVNFCQETGGLSGEMTVTTSESSSTTPVAQRGSGTISMTYACSPEGLSTTLAMPGLPDMVSGFSRLSE
jgi:hypothetical protein